MIAIQQPILPDAVPGYSLPPKKKFAMRKMEEAEEQCQRPKSPVIITID